MTQGKNLYNRKDIVEMAKIVSVKLNIPVDVVITAYRLFYEKIKEDIGNYDFESYDGDNSYESLMSFNIKHVGKLYTSRHAVTEINNRIKNKREKLNEDFEY